MARLLTKIMMTTNKPGCPSELDWLAFCYAAGELSQHDAEHFEARLATDQAAREALSRSVELTQTVFAAEAQSSQIAAAARVSLAATRSKTWAARVAWVAIGGIAAALLAVVNLPGPQKKAPSNRYRQLASAWSETRAEMATTVDDGRWPALEALSEFESDPAGDLAFAEVGEAPSWLTAALLGKMNAAPAAQALTDGPVEN